MEEILRQVKGAEQTAKSEVETAKREADEMVYQARIASVRLIEQVTEEDRTAAERLNAERREQVQNKLVAMGATNEAERREIAIKANVHVPAAVALIKERMVKRSGNS